MGGRHAGETTAGRKHEESLLRLGDPAVPGIQKVATNQEKVAVKVMATVTTGVKVEGVLNLIATPSLSLKWHHFLLVAMNLYVPPEVGATCQTQFLSLLETKSQHVWVVASKMPLS